MSPPDHGPWVVLFDDLTNDDVGRVGGKNASLGEMIGALGDRGVRVPAGFATTADAYRLFLERNDLDGRIREILEARMRSAGDAEGGGAGGQAEGREGQPVGDAPGASVDDHAVADEALAEAGAAIRELFLEGEMPDEVAEAVREAYRALGERYGREDVDVAVRSSATAEDLPEASFAGQQESFLNVTGEEALLEACRRCYASLFTDRAIAYREAQGFGHMDVALSVGVQKMVRSDLAGAGVLFTVDTETGFPDVAVIDAAWGLGESVVKGTVNPDRYTVYTPFLDDEGLRPIIGKRLGGKERKVVYADRGDPAEDAPSGGGSSGADASPEDGTASSDDAPTEEVDTSDDERARFVLDDDEILRLARWGTIIEAHYGREMDVEWAKDGERDELFVVQARPETVQSRVEASTLHRYALDEAPGEPLLTGVAIGSAVGAGPVQVILEASEMERFEEGSVLVTDMTDPDWVPVMRRAAAIVTDRGGRTSHAAIVSRELGVPAVVGTGDASEVLSDGQEVTVSCVEGDEGHVYEGVLDFTEEELDLGDVPETRTTIMMNVAAPAAAMRWWRLPCEGVGLARMEYLINHVIRVHPLALTRYDEVEDENVRAEIDRLTRGYEERTRYFVELLARGIATVAAAQHPHPVLVRTSDFKTNEYADLLGGAGFEPEEENPMLGWRGASRYYSDDYRDGFALECRAIRMAREEIGFRNVVVLIPFCRTPAEADRVLEVMAEEGLVRGREGLEVYVMAEVPSNVIEADAFAERFDGFSIGTNDLTQLVLGVGRDSEKLGYLFDERETSVTRMIEQLIDRAHEAGRPVGLCGQAPSDHPDFAEFLVEAGIDSISVNPDSVLDVIRHVAKAENEGAGGNGPPR